jgi:superfamily II DNA/RNA helicase
MARADWDTKLRAAFRGPMERLASAGLHRSAPGVTQRVVRVRGDEARMSALLETLVMEGDDEGGVAPGMPALVFTGSTEEADALTDSLVAAGLPAAAFHGKVKGTRGELLDELQAGELAVLVVTDFAARGLDLPQVRHVVQWRPAASPALHLHRIGRTGRASATGPCAATTLFDPEDAADAATAMASVLAAAEAQGWDSVGELLDTRRKASGEE